MQRTEERIILAQNPSQFYKLCTVTYGREVTAMGS